MQNNAKKLPKFYFVLIICWGVALGLLAVALLVFRGYLADYESVQPKYVAEEVFEKYFITGDYLSIIKHSSLNKNKYETDEMLADYISSLTAGKELSYYSVSSGMDTDSAKYAVKYTEGEKDIKFASFTLAVSDEKSEKGFSKYALDSFELFYSADISVNIKAIKGSVPYINGVPLDSSYIVEDDVSHETNAHMPDGVEGIKFTMYSIDGLTTEPEVKVFNADGTRIELGLVESDKLYYTKLVYDEALKEEQSEFVIEAAKNFAAYMQNDTTLAKLNPYFEKGTELYKSIRSTLQWAVIDHDSYDFENVEASDFYRYDENTFSCRVRLTHVLKRKRLEDYRDTMDATFYLRMVDGKYLIYDRTNN